MCEWSELRANLLPGVRRLTWCVLVLVTACWWCDPVVRADESGGEGEPAAEDPFAVFTDEALRAAVEKACARVEAKEENLTAESLLKIRHLDIRGGKIVSLAGLEQCTALTQLRAANNEIVDLGPLAGCPKLNLLDVSGNKVANLAPLAAASELRVLLLDGNQVEDLRPISECRELQLLRARGNKITDLTACAEMSKLHALLVSGNRIERLVLPSTMTALTTIDVSDNRVTDVSEVTILPRLNWLFLSDNQIEDAAPLVQAVRTLMSASQQSRWAGTMRLDGNPLSEETREQLGRLREWGATVTDRVSEGKSEDSEQSEESATDESKSSE